MTGQKAENLLNLAVDTPEAERGRTEELNVGFDPETRSWEIIVKYSGDLKGAVEAFDPTVDVSELLGGYAVLTAPESRIEDLLRLPEIEYAEKPKRLFFAVNQARAASCVPPVQTGANPLTGRGVIVAILDSGIDYFHEDFRNDDGSTRLLYLADQTAGRIYTREELNEALNAGGGREGLALAPSSDGSGHGTAVAGIAAGNGRASEGRMYRGIAGGSDLIVVKLGVPEPDGFPRTTQLMEGLDFVVRTAVSLGRPAAVNLSFGNTYGSHDGNGLLERFIDALSEIGRSVIVIGTGNEGDTGGHAAGSLAPGRDAIIELSVAPYETTLNAQLWKTYQDDFDVFLVNPSQEYMERVSKLLGPQRMRMGPTEVLLYYGEPGPMNAAQEIYFDFIPRGQYIESGIWKIILRPRRIVQGNYDLWLPSAAVRNRSTRFLRPTPETTLTIPSTAVRPISVGAYDDGTKTYAAFSGRGDTRLVKRQKPELAAPGVAIVAPRAGGGYQPVTGTSFAAPFVTGAAALLMEWGIVMGNDPYLYGDKVKAYLCRGARQLPGSRTYPNPQIGFGVLCVADSLPS